jgi:hypothetical protein
MTRPGDGGGDGIESPGSQRMQALHGTCGRDNGVSEPAGCLLHNSGLTGNSHQPGQAAATCHQGACGAPSPPADLGKAAAVRLVRSSQNFVQCRHLQYAKAHRVFIHSSRDGRQKRFTCPQRKAKLPISGSTNGRSVPCCLWHKLHWPIAAVVLCWERSPAGSPAHSHQYQRSEWSRRSP